MNLIQIFIVVFFIMTVVGVILFQLWQFRNEANFLSRPKKEQIKELKEHPWETAIETGGFV